MTAIRAGLGPGFYALAALLLAILVAIGILQPRQVPWLVVMVVGVAFVGWLHLRVVRLEISETLVRCPFRGLRAEA